MKKKRSKSEGIAIAAIAIIIVVSVIAYLDSLPPNVVFTKYSPNPVSVTAGQTAKIEFDIRNDEDYKVDILIKTQFDGPADYATIQNPEINESLNGNQPLGTDRENQYITFFTSSLVDSGEVTYKGNTTVTVMGETEPSDTRYFELVLTP